MNPPAIPEGPNPGQTTSRSARQSPRIAVVGGGFSGAMTAANLLREAASPLSIAIFEPGPSLGRGIAYVDLAPEWLLNVPADRMGAWAGQPDDFWRWARAREPSITAGAYLPRRDYGAYIRETLEHQAARSIAKLEVIPERVTALKPETGGSWRLSTDRGRQMIAAAAILCIGHGESQLPRELTKFAADERVIANPAIDGRVHEITPEDRILIVGSGLTMIDQVALLAARKHRGKIVVLSRRGLISRPHSAARIGAVERCVAESALAGATTCRTLTRAIRTLIATQGHDWRAAIDGLRPLTAELWGRLNLRERRRFLSRLAVFWDVHRHRAAPEAHRHFERLRDAGQLQPIAGRISRAIRRDGAYDLSARLRDTSEIGHFVADRILNCVGPASRIADSRDPFVTGLVAAGTLQPDELGLGARCDNNGAALDQSGTPVGNLFVVGPLRKADLWESIAVPELREQAAVAARCALASCAAIS